MHSYFARVNGKFYQIPVNQIEYIEAKKNYVNIHTPANAYCIHSSLSLIEEQLPEDLFCRIHRSFIIAIDKIVCFDHEKVYLKSIELNLGMNFYEELKNRIIIFGETAKTKSKTDVQVINFPEHLKSS